MIDTFRHRLDATGPRLSRRSDLAVVIRYAGEGRLEIDNNAAERSLRGIARRSHPSMGGTSSKRRKNGGHVTGRAGTSAR